MFAGAGGPSLGFEQAGFDVAAAVETDPIHAAVHSFNFPNCRTLPRTVVGLSGTEIRKAANIGSRPVDVVFGGAPCQGFSLIGQRALDDPRNQLVKDFVRLVAELEANHFVFENVKGLTLGRQRTFLKELIGAFSKNGYVLRAPWQVLNAAHFGVPQHRERLFLTGTKKGLEIPEYPLPSTSQADTHQLDRPAGPTCEDALDDLPEPEVFSQLLFADWVHTDDWGEPSDYARGLRCGDEFGWGDGFPDSSRFHATKWHGARQIGNSVPPPLAKAVAQQIIRALDVIPCSPTRILKLGDPKLLSLDMTHAARY